jgi:hypothetical protein
MFARKFADGPKAGLCSASADWRHAESHQVLSMRSNEMRDFGYIAQVEAVHAILDDAIGIGDPFMLAQMLRPRRDEKSLDDASFVGGILE